MVCTQFEKRKEKFIPVAYMHMHIKIKNCTTEHHKMYYLCRKIYIFKLIFGGLRLKFTSISCGNNIFPVYSKFINFLVCDY